MSQKQKPSSYYDKSQLWRLWERLEALVADQLGKNVADLRRARTKNVYYEDLGGELAEKGKGSVDWLRHNFPTLYDAIYRAGTQYHDKDYIKFNNATDHSIRRIVEFVNICSGHREGKLAPDDDGFHYEDLFYTERVMLEGEDVSKLFSILDPLQRKIETWESSHELENRAKEVICITPNLAWLNVNLREIAVSLTGERTRKYIVIDPKGRETISNIQESIKLLDIGEKRQRMAESHIKIHCLDDLPEYDLGENIIRPIPNDIVVYRNTRRDGISRAMTMAVMSTHPLQENEIRRLKEEGKYDEVFDVVLDREFVNPIIHWFSVMWKALERLENNSQTSKK